MPLKFLDYSMNVDLKYLSANDAESGDPRTFGIRERHDQMRSFRIIGAAYVGTGWLCRTVRMRMVDGCQFLSGVFQLAECLNQFRRIHFKLGRTLSGIRHRNKAAAADESTSFSWVCSFRVPDDFVEKAGRKDKAHG